MAHGTIRLKVGCLGSKTFVQEPSLAASECIKASLEGTVDFVIQTRHRWEQRWFESGAIFNKLQWVALVETNFESPVK